MSARGALQRGLVAVALATTGLVAQGDGERPNGELQRTQRALQQNRSEVDRLLDLRLRHDLGLLPAAQADQGDRTFRPTAPVTTEAMERMNLELKDEEAAADTMREKYEKLRVAVEQLRAEADAKLRAEAEQSVFVQVPIAGRAPSPIPSNTQAERAQAAAAPAPAGETAAVRPVIVDPVPIDPALDPMRAQIHGSSDHRRVAMALFRAGQALMDRAAVAREQKQDAAAKELDERGKERLRRALDELAPLLQEKEPPFDALFYQGKLLELLFRHAERNEGLDPTTSARDWQRREQEVREPFLKITARDVRKTGARGETEVLGAWGQAAQTALEHFRWMNLHAGYDARTTIEALTWPGERER